MTLNKNRFQDMTEMKRYRLRWANGDIEEVDAASSKDAIRLCGKGKPEICADINSPEFIQASKAIFIAIQQKWDELRASSEYEDVPALPQDQKHICSVISEADRVLKTTGKLPETWNTNFDD